MKNIFLGISLVLLFQGCVLNNQPIKLYKEQSIWVKNINKSIKDNNLDKAFEMYEKFNIEHPGNKYSKNILYTLAEKYDEKLYYQKSIKLYEFYLRKYSEKNKQEDIIYKQLMAKYHRLDRANHNYVLLEELISNISTLLVRFKNQTYIKELTKIKSNLILRKSEYDLKISDYYESKNNEYGKKLYKDKVSIDISKYDSDTYQPNKVWHSRFID